MRSYLTLLFVVIWFTVSAQTSVDKLVQHKVVSLKSSNVNLQVEYYKYCVGNKPQVKDSLCKPQQIKYLIWFDGKQCYMQRFDDCKSYEALAIKNEFIQLINLYYDRIEKEKIYSVTWDELVNGKKKSFTTFTAHTCYNTFKIFNGNSVLEKRVSDFDLETKIVDHKYRNKYYNRNQASILNTLLQMSEDRDRSSLPA